jgi:hypothetical protein
MNDGNPTGTVSSNAAINFNVSGTATVTTDATFQINSSDSATSLNINLNCGTYNVGGTFEGFMDGSGTMTLSNATIATDTLKAGVFGSNGTLRIGGGTLSAKTLLHLYAPGTAQSVQGNTWISGAELNRIVANRSRLGVLLSRSQ